MMDVKTMTIMRFKDTSFIGLDLHYSPEGSKPRNIIGVVEYPYFSGNKNDDINKVMELFYSNVGDPPIDLEIGKKKYKGYFRSYSCNYKFGRQIKRS